MNYATTNDVITLWRTLEADEIEKAEEIISLVSSMIRYEGAKLDKDTDKMAMENADWANIAKLVTVAVVKRYMNETDDSTQLSQSTQSALGYSISGTYIVGGGGIKLLNNEMKQLGFRTQRLGIIEMM